MGDTIFIHDSFFQLSCFFLFGGVSITNNHKLCLVETSPRKIKKRWLRWISDQNWTTHFHPTMCWFKHSLSLDIQANTETEVKVFDWYVFGGQKSYQTSVSFSGVGCRLGVGVLSTSITQHLELLIILAAAIATGSTWTLENKSWTRRVCLWTSFSSKDILESFTFLIYIWNWKTTHIMYLWFHYCHQTFIFQFFKIP